VRRRYTGAINTRLRWVGHIGTPLRRPTHGRGTYGSEGPLCGAQSGASRARRTGVPTGHGPVCIHIRPRRKMASPTLSPMLSRFSRFASFLARDADRVILARLRCAESPKRNRLSYVDCHRNRVYGSVELFLRKFSTRSSASSSRAIFNAGGRHLTMLINIP
jgi:hypothetical protein